MPAAAGRSPSPSPITAPICTSRWPTGDRASRRKIANGCCAGSNADRPMRRAAGWACPSPRGRPRSWAGRWGWTGAATGPVWWRQSGFRQKPEPSSAWHQLRVVQPRFRRVRMVPAPWPMRIGASAWQHFGVGHAQGPMRGFRAGSRRARRHGAPDSRRPEPYLQDRDAAAAQHDRNSSRNDDHRNDHQLSRFRQRPLAP